MTTIEIISAIGLVGIGGLLKSIFDFFIANKKQKSENKHQLKEARYKVIILLSYAYVNFEKESMALIIKRPDLTSKEALFNELNTEWINMALFASDKVITAMKKFLELEDDESFKKLTLAMRKDLYGIKTSIRIENLKLDKNASKVE